MNKEVDNACYELARKVSKIASSSVDELTYFLYEGITNIILKEMERAKEEE